MVSARWCAMLGGPRIEPVDHNDSSSTMNILLEISFQTVKYLLNHEREVIMEEQGASMSRFTHVDFGAVYDDLKQVLLLQLGNFGSERFQQKIVHALIDYVRTRHRTGSAIPLILNIKKFVFYDEVESSLEFVEGDGLNMVPASMDAITSLPMKEMEYEEDNTEVESCMICLEEIPAGLVVSTLPCSHVFHSYCISEWLTRSHYCPICRFEISTV
ncbi:putative E3 ubiquitin-protein ligase [Forsythia ovata]|uniref:E3 ubiquitin-protein ligase n=1 Tax=Forsythia ovata TaxID=205694 RepID=A0ABD1TC76_9LAMI